MKTVVKKLIIISLILIHFSCDEKKELKNEPSNPKKIVAMDSSINNKTNASNDHSIKKNEMERNKNLIGVWRNTEVLSSGTGDNYMSLATDYFLEFQENGTVLTWVGSSAGSGYSVVSEDRNNADKGEWRTSENSLFLKDPVTKQEAQTYYYVQDQRLMLSNEGSKKVFEKIK